MPRRFEVFTRGREISGIELPDSEMRCVRKATVVRVTFWRVLATTLLDALPAGQPITGENFKLKPPLHTKDVRKFSNFFSTLFVPFELYTLLYRTLICISSYNLIIHFINVFHYLLQWKLQMELGFPFLAK